jgi:imidazolonepropionase-like amidohydrolase
MRSEELLKDSLDLHIHVGPDPRHNRRVTAYEAAMQARDAGMRGIVLKSHHYVTTPVTTLIGDLVTGIEVYGSLVLNTDIGGLNPVMVELAGKIGTKMVWMPTLTSRCELEKRGIKGKGIFILDEAGSLLPVVIEILELIKRYDMTLATGHISVPEVFALLAAARSIGLPRTVVTHPLSYSFGCGATIEEQKRMAGTGVFIEHCINCTMPANDRIDPKTMVAAIRTVGAENCIMSTDFGQPYHPTPVEGMRMFVAMMLHLGLTEEEIICMVRTNPAKALGLQTR